MRDSELVVLVPGAGLGGVEFLLLARRLRDFGYTAKVFYYMPWYEPVGRTAERLEKFLSIRRHPTIHLVGHSLGGIVILRFLHDSTWDRAGRLVTLGTPHRGIEAAARISRVHGGRTLLGPAIRSAQALVPIPAPEGRELGSLAGRVNLGIGRILSLPQPNDSVVGVDEALHPGSSSTAVVRASHSSMLVQRRVALEIDAFLQTGAFL